MNGAFSVKDSTVGKGIAILLMLFHHLFNDYEEYAGYAVSYFPFSGDRLTYLAVLSKICVAVFVFISGYGIAASFGGLCRDGRLPGAGEVGRFVRRRYVRLMAAYWFAFALTLVCQPLGRTIFDAYGTGLRAILACGAIDVLGLSFICGTPTLNPTWWYMSVALFVCAAAPLIVMLMKKVGSTVAAAALFLTAASFFTEGIMVSYFVVMLAGIWCCETDLFGRVETLRQSSPAARRLVPAAEAVLLAVVMLLWHDYNRFGLADALAALLLLLLAAQVIVKIPVVSSLLGLLGRHSGNMFLMHNQLYSFYFLGFFYSFRHWALILLVLTAVSLAVSVLMEYLKKLTHYNVLTAHLEGRAS